MKQFYDFILELAKSRLGEMVPYSVVNPYGQKVQKCRRIA